MKHSFFTYLFLIATTFAFAQNGEQSPISFFKSMNGYVYADNSQGAHFTIAFKGDSLQTFDNGINAFNVSKNLYQILMRNYTVQQYTNKAAPSKEEKLLLHFKNYEADYHSKEIHKQPLDISEEFFFNADGKKFHLWYFPQPPFIEGGDLTEKEHSLTSWHLYLSFVANQKVVVIYSPILNDVMSIEEKIAALKEIAESANIFGGPIDVSALSYKLRSANEEGFIEYYDSLGKYSIDIPEWLNITQSGREGLFFATLPDFQNVKNAISVEWFEKAEYKTIEDFNQAHVLKYKMGDAINKTHTFMLRNEYLHKAENQSISYKVQLMGGNTLYNTHVVTYEMSTGYLLCRFIATQETYKRNLPKFFEILSGIEFD